MKIIRTAIILNLIATLICGALIYRLYVNAG